MVPKVKVTVPVGAAVPLTGLTVAIRTMPFPAPLAGVAETIVVVAGGVVTVMVMDALEPVKEALPL